MSFDFRFPALESIATSLAQLVAIQKQRAATEQQNMIAVADVKALIDDFNAVILAKTTEDAALTTALANLATAQAQIADFNDPALAASLAQALANAAASTPPATIPPPVVIPPPDTTPPATTPPAFVPVGNQVDASGNQVVDINGQPIPVDANGNTDPANPPVMPGAPAPAPAA